MTELEHSPAPWSYDYNPYRVTREPGGIETELAAFEIVDADCNKIFDTNEDTPCELQEANARMAAAVSSAFEMAQIRGLGPNEAENIFSPQIPSAQSEGNLRRKNVVKKVGPF